LKEDKPDQTASRGASGLTDGSRLQFNFIKHKDDEEIAVLIMTKTNFTAYLKDNIYLRKETDGYLEKTNKPPEKKKENSCPKRREKSPSHFLGVAGIDD
jgi:hypothetical protein